MGFASETRQRSAPILPLAGMVDVLFLLLIFFMTASVFRDNELQMDVALPGSENPQLQANLDAMQTIVTIDEADQLFLGQRPITMEELRTVFGELSRDYPNETVVVRGDRDSSYGVAVEVMDLAQAIGIRDVRAAAVRKASNIK